jgi:hypothetical protein
VSTQHKVDGLRRYGFRRTNEISFVLAILIINNDHYLATSYRGNGLFNGTETETLIH